MDLLWERMDCREKKLHMNEKKFDPEKLHKLNDPERLTDIPPLYLWEKLDPEITGEAVVVDVGAGTGFFSVPFADFVRNGKVYACDISDKMISWMKENVCQENSNIYPLKMQEHKIPLETGSTDLVLMINLYHEIENPELLLAESFRILKSKGKICIVDWKKEEMSQGPPLHIRYVSGTVKSHLAAAGFGLIGRDESLPKHFLVFGGKP